MLPGLGALRVAPILARHLATFVASARSGQTVLDTPRPPMPEGRVSAVPGSGDLFWRDTGEPAGPSRGTVLLLHGWLVPSDPHWFRTFTELYEQGWRVIALDARGHGRGLRPAEPFRLEDCAADAAALIQYLECGPVIVVGYSMGGLIAQILARRRLDLVSGLVLCATAMELRKSLYLRMVWQGMGVFQWFWRLAPQPAWDVSMQMIFRGDRSTSAWAVGELRRGAAWDIGEAGREIGRFDSRPWIDKVHQPTAVVLTTLDLLIPPSRQRDLAACLHAPVVEVQADHMAPVTTPRRFHRGLSRALDLVEGRLTEDARPSLRAVGGAGRPA